MKQKKYYKTWKFWITSLLALSASSIITSLALTSCVANDTSSESNIVINSQTEDQEISLDDNKDLTLSVEATSNKGEDLSYQWYVNKNINDDNNAWEKIKDATQKTYTIPASDLQNNTSETTWKYKVEIYHNSDESKKVESKPISVKIKPSSGGSVPDKPTNPKPEPSPTPPTPEPTPPAPDLNPDKPSNPTEPTPPENPPSRPDTPSTPDNPSIVPSPEHKPSQGIGARLPLDKTGIVTTKYDQEKWIGDNSVSLMIEAKPNVEGIRKAVDKFNKTTQDVNIRKMLDSLVGTLNGATNYSYNQFGTGWILDYSNNKNGLTDYYIATNMHVLNSYYEIIYESTRYDNYNYEELIRVGVRIPFNKHTISKLDVYMSQPTYDTNDHKNNLKSYADKLSSQWYKTNVSIDNWNDSLVPLGAYDNTTNPNFSSSQPFDMELTWEYQKNNSVKQTLYFQSDNSDGYLTSQPVYSNYSFQTNVDDFSVFKIGLDDNAFNDKINAKDQYSTMFARMKKLFSTNSLDVVDEKSSYIKKLNKLLELTANNNSNVKADVDKLFMFGDSSKITNPNTQISIGGYPLIQELVQTGNTYKRQSYTTFNTNTLTGNNIIYYPEKAYPSRDRMGINQYTHDGKIYKLKWKGPNNFILKNVNLLAGSSGGIAIDKDYKISCINWGSYIHIEYHDGIKYVLDSSSSTGLYSSKDKNSLIWKWVTYTKQNNKNTKLTQLFDQLEKINYFNK